MIKFNNRLILKTKSHKGFILLEVIICLIILSVVIGTLMRSFNISLKTIRKTEVATVGSLLAEELMDRYEVFPPKPGEIRENFEDKGEKYSRYHYVSKLKVDSIDYDGFKLEGEFKELEPIYYLTIDILYDDPIYGETLATHIETYLLGVERFTYNSKKENAIF